MNDEKKTTFESTSEARAVDMFRRSPEEALSGAGLVSAETDKSADRSLPIANLAVDEPERFIELVSYLPHAIQDIFFQFYFLGRTQTQIGELMDKGQTVIWQTLELGTRAICAIIHFGSASELLKKDQWYAVTRTTPPEPEHSMIIAFKAALAFRTKPESREDLVVEEPDNLGDFEISANDINLMDFFAPSTTDGPVGKEAGE